MNMGDQNVNQDLLSFEDCEETINSRMGVVDVSSGGNQWGSSSRTMQSLLQRPRQKGLKNHFFKLLIQRWLFKIRRVKG